MRTQYENCTSAYDLPAGHTVYCGRALDASRSDQSYTKCDARLTISALILHFVVSELCEEPVLSPRPVSGCAGRLDVTMTLLAHIEGPQISSSPVEESGRECRYTESLHDVEALDAVRQARI